MPIIIKIFPVKLTLNRLEHDKFMRATLDWVSERHEYLDRITGHANPYLFREFRQLFNYNHADHGELCFLRKQIWKDAYIVWDTHRKVVFDELDDTIIYEHFYDVMVQIPDDNEAVLFKLTVA